LVGIVCSVVGVFVVTKGLSFIGAGIAHAAFAGVTLGFLIGAPPLALAVLFSLVTVWLIQFVGKKGQLRLDGQEWPFQGNGYHDHNWGNVDLNRVLSRWHWGRFHLPPYMGIFVEMKATPAYGQQRILILMVAREGRIIFETGTGHIRLETANLRAHPSGHRYPTYLAWLAEVGERQVHITMRDSEPIGNYSLLETLPSWKRIVARLLGKNPYYFRFRSWMTLELQLPEAQETLSGPVYYEIMRLT